MGEDIGTTLPPHSDTALTEALETVEPPKRPDITPAQIVGMIPLLAEFLHSFGVFTLSGAQQDSLEKLLIGGIALFGADAVIRFGRNLASRV